MRALFAVVLSATCLACDPGYTIEGRVLDPADAGVMDATVNVDCLHWPFQTVDGGVFRDAHLGCGPRPSCNLTIEAAGFAPWSAKVSDVCVLSDSIMGCPDERCWHVVVEAHLTPAAPAP